MKTLVYGILSGAASCVALAGRLVAPVCGMLARFLWLTCLRSRVDGRVPVTTQFDGAVRTGGRPRLSFGEHCRLGRDTYFETSAGGSIAVGAHVRINTGTLVASCSRVAIGDDCLIGEYVSIRDANHGTAPGGLMRLQEQETVPISIGKDVWICRGSVILKGVTIGDGAVVGANSVVTHDVPPGAVVAGAPARVVKFRDGRRVER